ncbi:hypothetical protein GCM10008944_09450 [Cytobacillus oceanisediminis]
MARPTYLSLPGGGPAGPVGSPFEAFRSLTRLGAEAAQPQDESEPTQPQDETRPEQPGRGNSAICSGVVREGTVECCAWICQAAARIPPPSTSSAASAARLRVLLA